jgi:hypothetical protein
MPPADAAGGDTGIRYKMRSINEFVKDGRTVIPARGADLLA